MTKEELIEKYIDIEERADGTCFINDIRCGVAGDVEWVVGNVKRVYGNVDYVWGDVDYVWGNAGVAKGKANE